MTGPEPLATPAGEIAAGYVSFTDVPADHRDAYRSWHALDHRPEQRRIAGIRQGAQWELTAACRTAAVRLADPFADIHAFTLYLMAEPLAETLDAFYALGRELGAEGRFFEHRRSRLAGALRVVDAVAAPGVELDPAALGFVDARHVFVVVRTTLADAPLPMRGTYGWWSLHSDATLGPIRHHDGPISVEVAWLAVDPTDFVYDAAGDDCLLAAPFEAPARI